MSINQACKRSKLLEVAKPRRLGEGAEEVVVVHDAWHSPLPVCAGSCALIQWEKWCLVRCVCECSQQRFKWTEKEVKLIDYFQAKNNKSVVIVHLILDLRRRNLIIRTWGSTYTFKIFNLNSNKMTSLKLYTNVIN